jgi:carboxylesterase
MEIGSKIAAVDRGYYVKGGRTGFLLIHGLGGTPVELRFVAHGLSRCGYAVYCPQLAGHCASIDELRDSSWQDWYASVEAAHDRLRQDCDIVIAGGLSMGALMALHLAHNRPKAVDGLALFAPTLRLDGWSMPWHSVLLRLIRPSPLRTNLNLTERPPYGIKNERIRGFVLQHMQSGTAEAGTFATPVRSMAHFNAFASVVRRELGAIKTPTLIVHPRDDDMASLKNAMVLQRRLAGLVELLVLDDSYHMITLDQQRHLVVERALSFAADIERRLGELRETVEAGRRQAAE